MTDTRTYIKVHDGMPDHPKVDGLSDRAFRLLVESWCWCSRHLTDGRIPAATWRKRSTPKARRELIDAGLAEETDGGDILMHDYLEHQRSAAEVAEAKAAKGKGGALGNHRRWHEKRGVVDPDCPHCPDPPTDPKPIAKGSQNRSDNRSHSDRKSSPETTTETETEGSPTGIPGGAASRHPADRYARGTSDDDDLDELNTRIEGRIIELIREGTGRTVDRAWAAKVRAQLLNDREVANPLAYVATCIREDPARYAPTPTTELHGDPPPPLPPRDPDAYEAGAARAREAMIAARRARADQNGAEP